jgi:beta-RFAP synthase
MIRVRTGSRLHFGLFSLPSEQAGPWLNQQEQSTIARRQFGGVGLMIEEPGLEVTVDRAQAWSAQGPLAERALWFAQAYGPAIGMAECVAIRVHRAAPEHRGLGTGTQLALAVARALNALIELDESASTTAQRVARGMRSAIGIHGFARGGFLVEAGKTSSDTVSPLVFHHEFPPDWGILLVLPRDLQGTHGRQEVDAFAELARRQPDDRLTESLCRIVLLGMLPAIVQRDLATFGEALYDFNRRSGAMFKSAQGGIYCHPRVEEIVKKLHELGVRGVGQSSWGPAIFAIVNGELVKSFRAWLVEKGIIADDEGFVTSPNNNGAVLNTEY